MARVVTVAAVLLVATVAALVSYAHMREVAERAGEQWRAWLLPLSVDGLVVAASMVLLTRRRVGLPGGWLAWCALLGGVGASLAANVAAADPSVTARLVAAWPALAFAVAFELLLQQRRGAVVRQVEVVPGHPDHAGPVADHRPDQTGPDRHRTTRTAMRQVPRICSPRSTCPAGGVLCGPARWTTSRTSTWTRPDRWTRKRTRPDRRCRTTSTTTRLCSLTCADGQRTSRTGRRGTR